MFLNEKQLVERLARRDDTRIVIKPVIDIKQFNPASFDLRLGTTFKLIKRVKFTHLDPLDDESENEKRIREYSADYHIPSCTDRFYIHPDEFVLASTLEFLKLPNDIGGILQGRSSWGRIGLMIHSTAGFVDPGFTGTLTYELRNNGKVPIPLHPGVRIGQISFFKIQETHIPYEKGYSYSLGVGGSRFFKDIEYRWINKIKKQEGDK